MKFCILLTSTIRPNITVFSKRNDPRVRERDYRDVVYALAKTDYPIVFCDSSDYPLDNIKGVLDARAPETYEVLQFDGSTFPAALGKGYGELQIIKYALEHSKILKGCDFIVKITGRYSVQNLEQILDSMKVDGSTLVVADYAPLARYTYSGFFIARPIFFTKYLFPLQDFLNDSEKRFFEIALHQAIQKAEQEGSAVLPFPVKPLISGYSGTWNVKMAEGNYKDIKMSLPKMRIIISAYWKALQNRLRRLFHEA